MFLEEYIENIERIKVSLRRLLKKMIKEVETMLRSFLWSGINLAKAGA